MTKDIPTIENYKAWLKEDRTYKEEKSKVAEKSSNAVFTILKMLFLTACLLIFVLALDLIFNFIPLYSSIEIEGRSIDLPLSMALFFKAQLTLWIIFAAACYERLYHNPETCKTCGRKLKKTRPSLVLFFISLLFLFISWDTTITSWTPDLESMVLFALTFILSMLNILFYLFLSKHSPLKK